MSALSRVERRAEIVQLAQRHAPPGTFVSDGSGLVVDGWANVLTGLGTQRDKRLGAAFSRQRLLQHMELDSLFAGDWLIARACERPAADQVRRWVDVKVDGQKGSDDDIGQEFKRLGIKPKLREAITWARCHGGGVVILGISDGRDPEEPVDVNNVKSIDWAHVVDRWDLMATKWYDAPATHAYATPEVYSVVTIIAAPDGNPLLGVKVHETRTLRVDGVMTSRRNRLENNGWHHGVVQRLYDAVRDYHAAIGGAAHLATDFAQAVLKVKGLAKLLAEDKDETVTNRLTTLDLMRSLVRLVPLDTEEEFERKGTPVSGLPELLDRVRDAVCGAVDIPEKILFGKATAGLGDQGQSDLQQYYDQVASEQEVNVVPQLTRLTSYLYAQNGRTPKRWSIVPRPLWQPTEGEISENRKRDAETDEINIRNGIYTPDEARKSRYGGDGYGVEIVLAGDDEDLDSIESAAPEDADPQSVEQVTPQAITAATDVVAKAIAGDITVQAARVLLRAALKLEEQDVEAMLAGVEQERARREEEAKKIAAAGGMQAGGAPGQTAKKPPPGSGPGGST